MYLMCMHEGHERPPFVCVTIWDAAACNVTARQPTGVGMVSSGYVMTMCVAVWLVAASSIKFMPPVCLAYGLSDG